MARRSIDGRHLIPTPPTMRIPILTYHAGNVAGSDYSGNDHVALATDLAMFSRLGWRVVPLQWVVDQRLGRTDRDLHRCLALTCDDGTDLDFRDVDYPQIGTQRGFLNILRDAQATAAGTQPDLHMSTFVIADPLARTRMDRDCLHDLGWMNEDWWAPAAQGGLLGIECHSWDHNHPVMAGDDPAGLIRGDFHQIASPQLAQRQIDQALDYINKRIAPRRCRFFAYPYGHASEFLAGDYLPANGARLGLDAAFGVGAEPVTGTSTVWNLPRYVCGPDWKSPDGLRLILDECGQR